MQKVVQEAKERRMENCRNGKIERLKRGVLCYRSDSIRRSLSLQTENQISKQQLYCSGSQTLPRSTLLQSAGRFGVRDLSMQSTAVWSGPRLSEQDMVTVHELVCLSSC